MPTLTRRNFLTYSAAGGAGLALGGTTRLALGDPNDPATGDVLVCVFLRGGADGLSLVAPYGDPDYATIRPRIAVPPPSQANGALDLNGFFGMHPAMTDLFSSAWANGHLAVVNAVGLPASESDTRSHFEAQDYWERSSANPSVRSGWLGRHLATSGASGAAAGIGLRSSLPVSLKGFNGAISVRSIGGFRIDGFPSSDLASVQTQLNRMYAAAPGLFGEVGRGALTATSLVAQAGGGRFPPQNGAVYPRTGLGTDLRSVGELIRAQVGLRAAAIDVGGWDMHDDMGTVASGPMADRARQLSQGLAAFYTDMGAAMSEVTVVTMSEFGRTVKENGSNGTDHGRGSCMFVMGGGIKGGVYGPWPGVVENADPDRDLSVTTDFRTVLSEVVRKRLDNPNAAQVFPGYTPVAPLGVTV
jgi:uncharacterized protein (DUF1501 family)